MFVLKPLNKKIRIVKENAKKPIHNNNLKVKINAKLKKYTNKNK
jgi:hypothetical protein